MEVQSLLRASLRQTAQREKHHNGPLSIIGTMALLICHSCGASAAPEQRFCGDCGGRMTVQVIPTGYAASCLRCERRARAFP